MFTSLLGELKGWFGRAFLLAVWLPVFIFASAASVVYLAGAGAAVFGATAWARGGVDDKIVLSAEFILAVTLVAFVVDYVQVPITRLFEGYWPALRPLERWRRRRYERALGQLDDRLNRLGKEVLALKAEGRDAGPREAELNRLTQFRLLGFPPPGYEAHLMPTRLGNLYKAAELYPFDRYGADSVIIWPRLREVLPDKLAERLQEVKTAVDFLLLFSFLSSAFTLLSVPYLWSRGAQGWLVLACAAGLPLGWLSYRAALSPAQAYAELLKVAFDLHRRALLKALGLRAPATLGQEREMWRKIVEFIYRGFQPEPGLQFDAPPAKEDG